MNEPNLSLAPQADTQLVFADDSAFTRALKLAETMATAKTLPKHLTGSPGDCLRVVELALRTNQSPYALADKTFLVGGKIAFEGQLCAALLNASPILAKRLSYEYTGEGDAMACTVSATIAGETEPRVVVVRWKDGHDQSPSNKPLWKRQPEQQLAYWGARVWGRRHAPEVLMGIYTPDEVEVQNREMRNVTPPETDKPALPPRVEENAEAELPAIYDDLIDAIDAAGIDEDGFLAYATATGKTVPAGGYGSIVDIPKEKVEAALKVWPKIQKECQAWLKGEAAK